MMVNWNWTNRKPGSSKDFHVKAWNTKRHYDLMKNNKGYAIAKKLEKEVK